MLTTPESLFMCYVFGNCLQLAKFHNLSMDCSEPAAAIAQVLFLVLKVDISSDFLWSPELLTFTMILHK